MTKVKKKNTLPIDYFFSFFGSESRQASTTKKVLPESMEKVSTRPKV
jgi:hypothetical protein